MNFSCKKLLSIFFMLIIITLSCGACALLDMWGEPDTVKLDTQSAFSECLKICYDNGTRVRNSYSSCLDGCGRAANDFPLSNDRFASLERCEDEVSQVKSEGYLEHSPYLCDDVTNARKRQGCAEGAAAFYQALADYSACLPLQESNASLLAPPSPTTEASPGDSVVTQDLSD